MGRRNGVKLSIIIPCFNEEKTLPFCLERVLDIQDCHLSIEIIIVDDCSSDNSLAISHEYAKTHPEISVFSHKKNMGKGAALRTGFQHATGDFVAVQDADLEYNPEDLKRLIQPLIKNEADVVLGSRFLTHQPHRVLYFWHSLGNRFLTLLSNMFTDLNLTDMETCYKVFKREIIQTIDIKENRFGFEPEIVAKIAQMRLRIFEMGISYYGRTHEEGKKIGVKDGFRALYCIFRYNAHKAPLPIQLVIYLGIGAIAALANLTLFLGMLAAGLSVLLSAPLAFILAAVIDYFLCISWLFRQKARWSSLVEIIVFTLIVCIGALLDLSIIKWLLSLNHSPAFSKFIAFSITLIYSFAGRRFLVFPEKPAGAWKPQQ